MVEADGSFEAKLTSGLGKAYHGDAIAEDVMDPSDVFRLGIDLKTGTQQRLIETVARPEHQPVLTELDRPLVPVGGNMPYEEYGHQSPTRVADKERFRDLDVTTARSDAKANTDADIFRRQKV
jgi:hypothetical protein